MAKKSQIERRKEKQAAARRAQAQRTQRPPRGLAAFSTEDTLFWLAHGVNFLASDYGEGIWDPLLEGIYQGHIVGPDTIARTVSEKFGINEEGELSDTGFACLAWTAQDQRTVYGFSREALRRVKVKTPDGAIEACREPGNPIVWEMFQTLKGQFLQRR